MKKISICIMMLILSATTFCQNAQSSKPKTRKEYLALSRSQKVGGFILLGAGVTTIALISRGNTSFDELPILAVLGAAATVGSLPLFIASGRNRRRAMNASTSLKFEEAQFIRRSQICFRAFPAVSVKISF